MFGVASIGMVFVVDKSDFVCGGMVLFGIAIAANEQFIRRREPVRRCRRKYM